MREPVVECITLAETWRKSSYCSNNNCVEVRIAESGAVAVRDNGDPNGPSLLFSRQSWMIFIAELVRTSG